MHHFIFSKKDTFITNETEYVSKNFGLTDYLEVSSVSSLKNTFITKSLNPTYISDGLINQKIFDFNGLFTGSICNSTGSLIGNVYCGAENEIDGICEPSILADDSLNTLVTDIEDIIYVTDDYTIYN